MSIDITCQQCGQHFFDRPGNHRKFCSRVCADAWKRGRKNPEHAAALKGRPAHNRTPDEILLADVRAVADQLKHSPRHEEYRVLGKYNDSTVSKRFGLWEEVLKRASLEPFTLGQARADTARKLWQRPGYRRQHSEANHPQWEGGHGAGYRGPNWNMQRKLALERDHRQCQSNPAHKGRIHVHHKIDFDTFGYIPGQNDRYLQANELANLICLCTACHKRAHHGSLALLATRPAGSLDSIALV